MIRRWWARTLRCILLLVVGLVSSDAAMLALAYPSVGMFALLLAGLRRMRRRWRLSTNYGSARFADLADVLKAGLAADSGLILGKLNHVIGRPSRGQAIRSLFDPFMRSEWAVRQCLIAFLGSRWIGDVFLRVHAFTHLLTVAPAGGGKTTHTLGPNLLSYRGNCVVIDPKGELYRLSAEHRRKRFGHKTIRLDPALLLGPKAHRFNPMDFIDPHAKRFLSDCRDMANMLVTRTGAEDDPHWNDSAENVSAAFISYVSAREENREFRTLQTVRGFLASEADFEAGKRQMQMIDGYDGVLQQLGHSLNWLKDREGASVLSNVQRHTNFLDDPLIADATAFTNWNPRELRTGRMTVYIVIPGDRLVVWAGLTRLWLGMLLRIVTRGVPTEQNPVLFLIDEAAHIGKMRSLEDAITLLRGSGVRVWMFFQSLAQLRATFGDHADTVLDNLGTQQYYSITSFNTADELSKRMGDTTVVVLSEGDNSGSTWQSGSSRDSGRSRNRGSSSTLSETSRRVLKPEEILGMDDEFILVFHRNLPVIPAGRIRYYADPAFRGKRDGRLRGLGLRAAGAALAALCIALLLTLGSVGLTTPRETAPVVPDALAPMDSMHRPALGGPGPEPPPLGGMSRPRSPVNRRPLLPGLRRPSFYGGLNHGEGN